MKANHSKTSLIIATLAIAGLGTLACHTALDEYDATPSHVLESAYVAVMAGNVNGVMRTLRLEAQPIYGTDAAIADAKERFGKYTDLRAESYICDSFAADDKGNLIITCTTSATGVYEGQRVTVVTATVKCPGKNLQKFQACRIAGLQWHE